MLRRQLITSATLLMLPVAGLVAIAQFTVPQPPRPPTPVVGQPQGEPIAVTELRIGLQKAQIQATLADRTLAIKETAFKNMQARSAASGDQENMLNTEADLIMSRAAAEIARLDVSILDSQMRAGPAALQQMQNSQPPANGQQGNPLAIQLLQVELKKAQLQTAAVNQIVPIKQKIYDRIAAQQAVSADTDKLTDASLDLESTKAMQASTSLDEQLAAARLNAMGGRR